MALSPLLSFIICDYLRTCPSGQDGLPKELWRDSCKRCTIVPKEKDMPDNSHAISEALEAERRRLATRLRESLISPMNLIQAQIRAYEMNATGDRMAFSVLDSLLRQALQQAYDFEASLNPSALETLGLEAALEALASQERRSSGAMLSLNLPRLRERLPAFIELALFRATQDALEQAVQQRRASQIMLQIEIQESILYYSFLDNGSLPNGEILQAAQESLQGIGTKISLSQSRYGGLAFELELVLFQNIDLTEREIEVLAFLAEGMTNKEIAHHLNVQPRTIKFHLDNIYSKLGVSTRTEAAIFALKHQLVKR
jgi:DNA-binding CsgD family transcriptional regulator